jgi:hypothetical protein
MEERIEKQELYCHACGNYVQFPIDLSMDGNYVLNCPNCGHEHCRVVKNGMITGERFDSRNGNTYQVGTASITYSATSASTAAYTFSVSGTSTATSNSFLYIASGT